MKRMMMALMIAALSVQPAAASEIKARVKGLVCAYCAQGLKKAFSKVENIEHVMVDLDAGLVTLHTKGTTDVDDATITSIVTDAGFTLSDVKRSEAAGK